MKDATKKYRFRFDRAKDCWICSIHGEAESAWLPCWNGCDEGYFDAYEDDPINNDEGDLEMCQECHGRGAHVVCAECNRDNPDVQFWGM